MLELLLFVLFVVVCLTLPSVNATKSECDQYISELQQEADRVLQRGKPRKHLNQWE